jgi:hypothetical protein
MFGNVTLPVLGEPYHVTSLFTLFSQSDRAVCHPIRPRSSENVFDEREPTPSAHTTCTQRIFWGWEFAPGRGTRNERLQAEGKMTGRLRKFQSFSVVEAFVGTQSEARVTATASQKLSTTGWLLSKSRQITTVRFQDLKTRFDGIEVNSWIRLPSPYPICDCPISGHVLTL